MAGVTTCVVLLRGINVGGNNRLAMSGFRAAVEAAGGRDVATLQASGQAVARIDSSDEDAVAAAVGEQLQQRFGLTVEVSVRTADHLSQVVAANPYPELVVTPKQLHVVFLDATPDPDAVALVGTRHGDDEFSVGDRVLYLAFRRQSHDSPLLGPLKALNRGTGTARNWATVTKLEELARSRKG
jgi:uncharacterized protein (DUF1697 family)